MSLASRVAAPDGATIANDSNGAHAGPPCKGPVPPTVSHRRNLASTRYRLDKLLPLAQRGASATREKAPRSLHAIRTP